MGQNFSHKPDGDKVGADGHRSPPAHPSPPQSLKGLPSSDSGDPGPSSPKSKEVADASLRRSTAVVPAPKTPTGSRFVEKTDLSAPAPTESRKLAKSKDTGVYACAHQGLADIPPEVLAITNLTNLELSANRLRELPPDVSKLACLKLLDLSCNDLRGFPNSLSIRTLESILLAHNELTSLPAFLYSLASLRKLDLQYNRISSFESLEALSSLQVLRLAHNSLKDLPAVVGGSALTELQLSDNRLKRLPSIFPPLVSLATLDVSDNELSSLHSSVGKLNRLTFLDASINCLGALPDELVALTQLKELSLRDNQLTGLCTDLERLLALTKLDLSANELRSAHSTIFRLPQLTFLNLSSNRIKQLHIPDAPKCSLLRDLVVGDNLLSELPRNLALFPQLRVLHLGYNRIRTLDYAQIAALENLHTLCLSGNPLGEVPVVAVPESLSCAMRELYMASCSLKKVPAQMLARARGFRILDLRDNEIRDLPAEFIEKAARYGWVDVSHNLLDPALFAPHHAELRKRKAAEPFFDEYSARPVLRTDQTLAPERDAYDASGADTVGRREFMEDEVVIAPKLGGVAGTHLFAVFDGHGGRGAANVLRDTFAPTLAEELQRTRRKGESAQKALTSAFRRVNKVLEERTNAPDQPEKSPFKAQCGATACVCLVVDNVLWTANVGDARAVLSRKGQPLRLSRDHKPLNPDEEQRIRACGGWVTREGRVMGRLAVSRAFGDVEMAPSVSGEPHVTETPMTKDDEFLVIGCDGIWDVLSDRLAVHVAAPVAGTPRVAATKVRDAAYFNGSSDNISVIVVNLRSVEKDEDDSTDQASKGSWVGDDRIL